MVAEDPDATICTALLEVQDRIICIASLAEAMTTISIVLPNVIKITCTDSSRGMEVAEEVEMLD